MLFLQDDFARMLNRTQYWPENIRALQTFLLRQGTFDFPTLTTGLFSAARLVDGAEYTGYNNVWVRDNVHIAHAHLVAGEIGVACRSVEGLNRFFRKHRERFETIIRGEVDPSEPMNRPHVRFNGQTLEELPERWSHAQNDALGYFLWLYCKLALAGHIDPAPEDWELLGIFACYFRAIEYWQDEDSGHWEEARKVQASSIGAVVAGLTELQQLMLDRSLVGIPFGDEQVTAETLDELIGEGRSALREILPYECIQPDKNKRRRFDAALLFLIYPLCVVGDEMADLILDQVETHLLGECGVRRYLGDSFWCADYKALREPELRTNDVSGDMSARDALLQRGQEAQWCIFDPLLSTIYGRRYAATGDEELRRKQVHYLNRSLRQLTRQGSGFTEFRCPELYYLDQGQYVPNDVTPLLWTQANLMVGLDQMLKTSVETRVPARKHSIGEL